MTTHTNTATFAAKAQPLLARGIAVFPCRPNKAPITSNGYKAATTEPDQIEAWGRTYPSALVGVPTGEQGFFVLDIDKGHADGADGFATINQYGWDLPETRTHATQSGGAHMFFKVPDGITIRNSAGKLGPGLDVRGDGGYVIDWSAEGLSVEHGDTIADAPACLLDRLKEIGSVVPAGALPAQSQIIVPPGLLDNDDLSAGIGAPLGLSSDESNRLLAALDPDMGYSDWLTVGQALHHETSGAQAGLDAWVRWSSSGDKFPGPDELAAKWASFGKHNGAAVTMRSVIKMARDNGVILNTTTPNVTGVPVTTNQEDSQAIANLAALPLFDYDRIRKDEAERLGVKVSTLDEAVQAVRNAQKEQDADESYFSVVVPWDAPVDTEALLTEIASAIKRFIVCDTAGLVAATLWCAATWLVDVVHACPILMINAPEKACGKTQMLTVVGKLVPRPVQAAGISPSVLFRLIEKHQPTLLVDEIETVLTKEAEDLRGMVNASHTRDSAYVWRSVPTPDGKDFEPRRFSVFGFKAVAGIRADRLAETVTSRAIVVQLRRKLPYESVQRLRYADPKLFPNLQRKLARWAADNAEVIRNARPDLPEQLSDRDQDNWESLIAIADLAGQRWGSGARTAAVQSCTSSGETSQSVGVELLRDIKDVFDRKGVTRISMQDLLRALCIDDEAPWATWTRGNPMTARQLGRLLSPYGIKSKTMKTDSSAAVKGYEVEDFQQVFERYLYTFTPTL